MKKLTLLTTLISLGVLSFAAEWDNIPVPAWVGTNYEWQLQSNVSDDFNYTFNAKATKTNFGNNKWYNFFHNGWDGPGTTYWQHNHVRVDGDNLEIKVSKSNKTEKMGLKGINSGCVSSNNRVIYPVFVESSISVANISLASCFWLLAPTNHNNLAQSDHQEIDIIENYGNVDWFKQFTHISHHSFIRKEDPRSGGKLIDYQPKDRNSWYSDSRVNGNYGWGDWCWNNGNRRYMRMGVYWVGPKHFEYYIDGELVRVLYKNATATKVNNTWEYAYYKTMDGHFPKQTAGYTDVKLYATTSNYSYSKIQETSNNSNGICVVDPGNFHNGNGFTKHLDIVINIESQEWLARDHTPSDDDLRDAAKNKMKVDWVRVYKPVARRNSRSANDISSTEDMELTRVKLSAYPNPATDYINVSLNKSELAESVVELYNTQGAMVLSQNISAGAEYQLDIFDLANGMYILKVNNGSETLTQKFIKK